MRTTTCMMAACLVLSGCSDAEGPSERSDTDGSPVTLGNLFTNPSFESSTTGWGTWQGSLARVSLAGAPSGSYVVKVTRTTGTAFSIDDSPDTVPSVPAGTKYTASAYVRAASWSSVGKRAALGVRERANGQDVRTWSSGAVTLSNTWQKVTVAEATPGAGHTLDAYLYQDGASLGNAFYADAFDLRVISTPPPQDAGTLPPVDASAPPPPPPGTGPHFPRLGAYPIGAPHNYDSPAFRDIARKYHVVIVTQWPGWQSGRSMTMPQVMQDVKARSTVGTKMFTYVIIQEQPANQGPTDAYYPVWQKLNSEKWWLYPSGSSGSPVASTYPGATEINLTNFGKNDASGKNWLRWKADFDFAFNVTGDSRNQANPYLDGFFTDNVFWKPRSNGDFNLDGTTDNQNDASVARWYREGYKTYFDYMRSKWPNSLQIGNIADWGDQAAVLTPLDQVLDGGVLEGMIGKSYSVETWGGFNLMMAWYRKMIDACRGPKLAIFAQDNLPNGDYRGMRYGLGAALMDDGYYYVNDSTGYTPDHLKWFDEFDFDLGNAVQTRREAAWSQGVWRRDFENGIVLVNPKGNGARTVSLGGTFRKLSGTQDPATNNGATVTSVTLADRDGIILRR